MSDLPAHPAASAFRMMSDGELDELAASIKAHGLLYPIILGKWSNGDGQTVEGVIDGRNRLKACEIAKVEPEFKPFEGEDVRALIFSSNGERRSISIGQKALAHALIYPEPATLRRKGQSFGSEGLHPRIFEARTVIEHAFELVENVKSGIITLDNAYRQAAERKKAKEWLADGMRRLREIAADLADRVEAGDISFDEARTLLNERENAAREVRQTMFSMLRDFVRDGQGFVHASQLDEVPKWLEIEEYQTEFRRYFQGGIPELVEKAKFLTEAAGVVNRVVAQLDHKKRGRK